MDETIALKLPVSESTRFVGVAQQTILEERVQNASALISWLPATRDGTLMKKAIG